METQQSLPTRQFNPLPHQIEIFRRIAAQCVFVGGVKDTLHVGVCGQIWNRITSDQRDRFNAMIDQQGAIQNTKDNQMKVAKLMADFLIKEVEEGRLDPHWAGVQLERSQFQSDMARLHNERLQDSKA